MKILRYISLGFFAVLFTFIVRAQSGNESESVDTMMRSDGKIWVVVLVLLTILMGVIYVLTILDSRQKKLEKEIEKK